jgi:hypothetical protein
MESQARMEISKYSPYSWGSRKRVSSFKMISGLIKKKSPEDEGRK